jgi:hypothetical protein
MAARSTKMSHVASCSDGVRHDKETWRNIRPHKPDNVPPSVSMDTPGIVHPGDCKPEVA